MSNVVWNDSTNGVQFTARLPWTSVYTITQGMFTTCEEMAAASEPTLSEFKGAFAPAFTDPKGQQGQLSVEVTQPGQGLIGPWGPIPDQCGGTASNVLVMKTDSSYTALGCLDQGKIAFR